MSEIDRIYAARTSPAEFADGYFDYLGTILKRIDRAAVGRMADILIDARNRGARVFFIGNGGSAATASHFANDISIGTRSPHRPFRAVCLSDNSAIVTAIANDDGYENVFVQQLQMQMEPGDVVVAISCSGNSPNIVKAVEYASSKGATTIGLTAFDGGTLKQMANLNIHVPTSRGEYGPAEDVHMVLAGLLGSYLIRLVRAELN